MARKAQSMPICGFIQRKIWLLMTMFTIMVLIVSAHGGGGSDNSEGDPAKPNLRAKGLILVKIWCLIIVFVGTFVGGISPYYLRWNESFLLVGTQFAGGVFLATAMHFLNGSFSTFDGLTSKAYPFSFMLCTAGYLLTMLGDQSDSFREGEAGANKAKAPLIMALCFHSVFEGIAIGVAETKAEAWRLLWTVSLHKIFTAIAMSIALLQMMPNRPLLSCASYSFAFAISSSIGVAIGILIDATTQAAVTDWIYAISMGLACGDFLYVAINHLLTKGILNTSHKKIPFDEPFYRVLAVGVGATLISRVMNWE